MASWRPLPLALTTMIAAGGLSSSAHADEGSATEGDAGAADANDRGTIDGGSTVIGVTVDRELARLLLLWEPTINGAPMGSAEVAALHSTKAFADLYGASLGGSSSPENRYSIDGLVVNDPAYSVLTIPLPMEFASEVRAITGGMGADIGRTGGTAIEITTRSGGDELRGSVWSSLVPGALEGAREPPYRDPQTIMTRRELTAIGRLGADIGGPILKNKLWFYAGVSPFFARYRLTRTIHRLVIVNGEKQSDAEGRDLREEVPGAEKVYYADRSGLHYVGKLTYRLDADHSASLSVFGSTEGSGGDGEIGVDPRTGLLDVATMAGSYEAFTRQRRASSNGVVLRWASALLDRRLHLDALAGWHHTASSDLPADGTEVGSNEGLAGTGRVVFRRETPARYNLPTFEDVPGNACASTAPFDPTMVRCEVITYALGGPGFIQQSTLNRYQGGVTATALLAGLGRHVIKAGADIEVVSFGNVKGYSGGREFRESLSGSNFSERRFGYLTGPDEPTSGTAIVNEVSSFAAGGFLRHDWSILDKVTLSAGARLDAQALFDPRGRLGLALPAQISPNAGLIYDFTGRGRSRLFVHVAHRHPTVPVGLAESILSDDLRLLALRRAPTCNPNSLEGQKSEGCSGDASLVVVGSRTDPSQRWQSSGDRAAVPGDIDPPALTEVVTGGELEIGRGVRLGAHYVRRWVTTTLEDFAWGFDGGYRLGNPGRGEAAHLPEASRDYEAGTLSFDKDFAEGWDAHASYTLSSLRGVWPGFFRVETGQLAPHFTEELDSPYALALDNLEGPLPGDHTHRLRLSSAKELKLGESLTATAGLGYRGQSGGPTSKRGSDLFGRTGAVFIEPRGSGKRLPWVHSVDARAGLTWKLARDRALHLEVTVWNVFNLQEVTAVDEIFTFDTVSLSPSPDPFSSGQWFDPFSVTPNPSFGKPTAYQAPRAVQLASRVDF